MLRNIDRNVYGSSTNVLTDLLMRRGLFQSQTVAGVWSAPRVSELEDCNNDSTDPIHENLLHMYNGKLK